MGILAKILLPLAFIILAITGIGLIVIPFLIAALVLGAIIGRIALAEWIGFKFGLNFKRPFERPLLALIIGGIIIAILYMVPVVGFLTALIVSVWGLGCAVTAAFGGLRRERLSGLLREGVRRLRLRLRREMLGRGPRFGLRRVRRSLVLLDGGERSFALRFVRRLVPSFVFGWLRGEARGLRLRLVRGFRLRFGFGRFRRRVLGLALGVLRFGLRRRGMSRCGGRGPGGRAARGL